MYLPYFRYILMAELLIFLTSSKTNRHSIVTISSARTKENSILHLLRARTPLLLDLIIILKNRRMMTVFSWQVSEELINHSLKQIVLSSTIVNLRCLGLRSNITERNSSTCETQYRLWIMFPWLRIWDYHLPGLDRKRRCLKIRIIMRVRIAA